ncbi:MAG: hypothetical protein ABIK19_01620 [candidate division WOR-3 bacterium]
MINKLLKILFSNIVFKILAIILALSVWVLAILMRNHEVTTNISVKVVNLPADLVVTNINTEKISVSLVGTGFNFIKLYFKQPVYNLNLSSAKPGFYRVKLTPEELTLPASVLLKSITPTYSELTIEKLITKQISVLIPYQSEIEKGYYISAVWTDDTVKLSGPESEMRFIKELLTDSLLIRDFTVHQVMKKLKIILPDARLYKVSPESVLVIANIEKETTRIFTDIPINIVSTKYNVSVNPKKAIIIVHGPQSKINMLNANEIKININTEKLAVGEYQLPAEIILPKGVMLTSCEPKLFQVVIKQ